MVQAPFNNFLRSVQAKAPIRALRHSDSTHWLERCYFESDPLLDRDIVSGRFGKGDSFEVQGND